MKASWIGKGEDDGTGYMRCHFLDYFFGECFWFCGGSDEDVWFYFFDYREEIRVIFSFPVGIFSCIRFLCMG